MQNNVFLRLAQERYTTKHYNGQQIPREEFDTLLEILRLTPTSVNAQALHYFPENRGIYTQSDSSKKSSRNIWSLAVVSVDQRY